MKRTTLLLSLVAMVIPATSFRAEKKIELVRDRFANSEAIKLNLQAQEQMLRGDLTVAGRTVEAAMRKDPTLWLTYFMRARLRFLEERYELAIRDCNWVLRKYPKFIEAALVRAEANAYLGRYPDAQKELDHVIRIRPHMDAYARALAARAWFLATCPNPSFRNGEKAVKDASLACKLLNWDAPSAIDALAQAYAELGDFDSAMRYAEQALAVEGISLVTSKMIRRHLALFKEHRPVRIR